MFNKNLQKTIVGIFIFLATAIVIVGALVANDMVGEFVSALFRIAKRAAGAGPFELRFGS
jgi:hypothetical protein